MATPAFLRGGSGTPRTSLHTAGPLRRTTRRVGEPRSRGSQSNTCHNAHKTFSLKWLMQLARHCERYGYVGNRNVAFGTKRKCWNAPAISGAGGRPAVPSACRPRRPLTHLRHSSAGAGHDTSPQRSCAPGGVRAPSWTSQVGCGA
jgi:hypothetical protein